MPSIRECKALVPQLVSGVQLMFQPDLQHTKLLLAFGVNTVLSHGHGLMMANPIVHLRSMRARGAKVVVVDPRVSETARHADVHIQLRPGTDPAVLAFLVRHVLSTKPDRDYLADTAQTASIEQLRDAVAPFDAPNAARICDVPVAALEAPAELVVTSGRVAIETGTGTTLNPSSTLTEWLAWALSAVTGSLDRVGGSTFNPGFLRPFEDALPSGRATSALDPGAGPICRASSTAKCPVPRWSTRSRPARSVRCSCAPAIRRSPFPMTPDCAGPCETSSSWW